MENYVEFKKVQKGILVFKSDDLNCFDPNLSALSGQCFRFKKTNNVLSGVVQKRKLKIEQTDKNCFLFKIDSDFFSEYLIDYFDLNRNYAEILSKFCRDDYLKKCVKSFKGLHVLNQDPFEIIISFIISQNNNIPRIKGIIERLCINFGSKIDGNVYTFPSVETLANLSVDDLSVIRAGFRAKYIIDAAQKISTGDIDLSKIYKLDLNDAKNELMKIKGIGPKVANCALLFGFGFANAFPVDVWVKRVMAEIYPTGLPQCTKNYEGIAQQYLFEYYRNKQIK